MSESESSDSTENVAGRNGPAERSPAIRDFWLGAAVVYLVFFALMEAKLWRPGTLFSGWNNPQIAEAQAWWNGRLDLPERWQDTALAGGRIYSHFPAMFSIIAAGVVPWFEGVPHWFMVVVLALPVPLLAYVLFHRLAGSPWWGAVGAIGLVCGTSAWPVIDRAVRGAGPYFVNHTLALIGMLIFLIEYLGRRRVWVAGLGLILATLSRQLTVAFAIPLFWLACWGKPPADRRGWVTALILVGTVVAGVPMLMNTLKFGHPLDAGYLRIYEGRDDRFAMDARSFGLFSPHFVPRNLYHANLGFPTLHRIEMAGRPEYHLRPNYDGTGIWWTTPLLIWLLVDIRRFLADPAARVLLVAALLVYMALLFFHATGADQRGYNRFSLDYLPALFAVIVPACFRGRRRWISLGMICWGVVYFRWLI